MLSGAGSRSRSTALRRNAVVGSCLLALTVCATSNAAEPVSGDVLIDVTPERIPELVRSASAGDLSAASTLAAYYGALALENLAQKREWLRFGAVRGDCNSIQILIEESTLEEDKSEANELAKKFSCDAKLEPESAN